MENRGHQKRRIAIFILSFIILGTLTSSQSTVNEPVSVELAIFNFRYSWGYCTLDEGGHGDFYSPSFFTMGIVNNGTKKNLLEQVNITFIMLVEGCKTAESTKVLSNESGVPIILYPRYYWLTNITCDGGITTTTVRIQIKVDGIVINYGDVIYMNQITKEYTNWENWTVYKFHTERTKTIIPINVGGILTGLITLMLWTRNKKKREKNSFYR